VANGGDDLNKKVWFDRVYFGAEPPLQLRDLAEEPSPFDGATDVPRDVVLGWKPGIYADKHDVYFGDNFDNVNNASTTVDPGNVYRSRQDADSYAVPETLDFGRTYYWRIDEVNAPPDDNTIHRGNVWSFTVEPFAYPVENIIATASSSNAADEGPENTVDGSGLDADDLHSRTGTDMWISSPTGPQPTWILYEFDNVYELHEMWVWNHNTEYEFFLGFGSRDVTIEYSTDGTAWTELGGVPEFTQALGQDGYAHDTIIDFGGIGVKYVKLTANSSWGEYGQFGLSEVRFLYIPVKARGPNPDSGATGIDPDVVLSWRAGRQAATHNVYLSTSRRAVTEGTALVTAVPEASYDAGTLELGRTYHWRVDGISDAQVSTSWEGDVWSFAIADYLVVDGFEPYNDLDPGEPGSNRIFETWKDGAGYGSQDNPPYSPGNGSGSIIGHPADPFAELSIVPMPYYYNNTGLTGKFNYSEAEADISDLEIGPDWTKAGIRALTLYFYGDPGNSAGEQMYVKLNGAEVPYDGDAADIQEETWHEWNIDLTSFAGANLQNVTKIIIGFRDGGGSGVVYFDSIRSYPARCIPGVMKPAADLNDDCVVDHADLEILTNNWLMSTYQVNPAAPGAANLAGHWTFDNAANVGADSTGNNDGTVSGNASQSTNAKVGSGSLALDGEDDFINVRGGPFFSALDDDGDGLTVAAWVQFAPRETFALMRVFSTNMSAGGTGGWGFGIIQPPASLRFTTYGIRDYDTADLSSHLPDGQWIHVAAVYKSDGDVDFYIDGAWAETVAGDFSMNDTQGFLIGGLASATATEWFEGLIDDLRIYGRELSQGEVGWLAGKTTAYSQDLSLLLMPPNPAINAHDDGTVDFKDFAVLADQWLDEMLWPQP
jgi:hypothetical protein